MAYISFTYNFLDNADLEEKLFTVNLDIRNYLG